MNPDLTPKYQELKKWARQCKTSNAPVGKLLRAIAEFHIEDIRQLGATDGAICALFDLGPGADKDACQQLKANRWYGQVLERCLHLLSHAGLVVGHSVSGISGVGVKYTWPEFDRTMKAVASERTAEHRESEAQKLKSKTRAEWDEGQKGMITEPPQIREPVTIEDIIGDEPARKPQRQDAPRWL